MFENSDYLQFSGNLKSSATYFFYEKYCVSNKNLKKKLIGKFYFTIANSFFMNNLCCTYFLKNLYSLAYKRICICAKLIVTYVTLFCHKSYSKTNDH